MCQRVADVCPPFADMLGRLQARVVPGSVQGTIRLRKVFSGQASREPRRSEGEWRLDNAYFVAVMLAGAAASRVMSDSNLATPMTLGRHPPGNHTSYCPYPCPSTH